MKKYFSIWNIIGIIVVLIGSLFYIFSHQITKTEIVNSEIVNDNSTKSKKVVLKLYFANKDATGFIVEKRNITVYDNDNLYQIAINELIKGPKQIGKPILSQKVPTPTVFISERTAYVDLPSSYAKLGLGTRGETILIYGIANTIFGQGSIDEIRFLVSGRPARTLGHISLVEPIRRSR